MMQGVPFTYFHVGEYLSFTNRIVDIGKDFDLNALNANHLFETLTQKRDIYQDIITRISTRNHTLSVEEADADRDNSFMAIRYYLLCCEKRSKPEWEEAIPLLLNFFESNNWNLHRESYDQQTAKFKAIFLKLEEDEQLKAAAQLTGLWELIQEMQAKQLRFETAVKERLEMKSQQPDMKTMEASKAIRSSIEVLFQYVDVMQKVAPNGEYEKMIRKFNEVISEYQSRIRARHTRNKKAKEVVNQ